MYETTFEAVEHPRHRIKSKTLHRFVALDWPLDGIRIAGGKNVQVTNNLVNSVAANNAMEVGVFGDTGQPLESATVDGNVLIGGGGWNGTDRHGVHVGSLGSSSFFPNDLPLRGIGGECRGGESELIAGELLTWAVGISVAIGLVGSQTDFAREP